MKCGFIHLTRCRADNVTVFQRVSMNLKMTVGQAACRSSDVLFKACWLRPVFAESYRIYGYV